MQRKIKKRGRRPNAPLDPDDVDYIKNQVEDVYRTLDAFYGEAFTEASNPKYKGFRQPKNVETVDRCFDYMFSGARSLPEIYWKVLEELLDITRDSLPSRTETKQTTAAKSEMAEPTDTFRKEANINKSFKSDTVSIKPKPAAEEPHELATQDTSVANRAEKWGKNIAKAENWQKRSTFCLGKKPAPILFYTIQIMKVLRDFGWLMIQAEVWIRPSN